MRECLDNNGRSWVVTTCLVTLYCLLPDGPPLERGIVPSRRSFARPHPLPLPDRLGRHGSSAVSADPNHLFPTIRYD
jgi:hypothetical protein